MTNLSDRTYHTEPDDIKCSICGGYGAVHRQGKNICEDCLDVAVDFKYDDLEEIKYEKL